MSQPRLVLTPEHVEIRLDAAGLGSRFLALLVDSSFTVALSLLLAWLLLPTLPGGLGYALWATLNFLLAWGYHVYFEVRRRGQSPGKLLFGLRVVDGRGLPISVQQSFVRNVLRVLDSGPAFYGVGGFVCLLDPQRRRLGDLAADTLVIREARSFALSERIARSQQFNSLRVPRIIRALRHRVSVEEREFLLALCLRAEALEPRARFDLFEDVARAYRAKLGIEDVRLSGENLVRGLTAILFWDRRSARRPRERPAA